MSRKSKGSEENGNQISFSFRMIAPAKISSLLSKLPDQGGTPDSFPLLASLRGGSRAFPDSPHYPMPQSHCRDKGESRLMPKKAS